MCRCSSTANEVVNFPLVLIRECLVGAPYILELSISIRVVWVPVRVHLLCQLVVCPPDLGHVGVSRHAEDLVEILFAEMIICEISSHGLDAAD